MQGCYPSHPIVRADYQLPGGVSQNSNYTNGFELHKRICCDAIQCVAHSRCILCGTFYMAGEDTALRQDRFWMC